MTRQELDMLVGMHVSEAESIVKTAGLTPRTYHRDTIRTLACLPKDVVALDHDDNLVVVSAETQDSIDMKYGY